jgi:3-oxoacyl-[acyl-carrier protein] reductase
VLADAGAAVAPVARRSDRLAVVRAGIEKAGGRAAAIAADVLDRAAMARAFDRTEAELGVVDILVNNAGVVHADRAVELSEAEWRRVLGTNLDAALYWSQEAARRLIAVNKGGAIVNIASILGFGVAKGVAAYAVSKAGLIQLTKALGLEFAGRAIRVNALAPGWIVTDLNRDYLASDRSAAILKDIPLWPLRRDARSRRCAFATCVRCRPLHHWHDRGGRRRASDCDAWLDYPSAPAPRA